MRLACYYWPMLKVESGPKREELRSNKDGLITWAADGQARAVVRHVLELGIVVHSVIIGISLGISQSSSTVKPLLGALSFHQFFD
ncbi:uncharacterized protein A4U43_C03F18510 [Asparagus officinalis]|uniref:Uncharacterized protein n=1 Tax=Asparagus officinalis TaxID=4686 RepID=A0A5P1FG38_ASPOF|nr:uncharacterized protein A4U43_C03F18510 [Asparagus officinalis]